MKPDASASFDAQLKALREAAGFTQEELATIAGLSVQAVKRAGARRKTATHVETARALSAALDLTGATREALVASARAPAHNNAVDELSGDSLPLALTPLLGRDADVHTLRRWLADPAARLITLTGPGGAGKSRLALEIARAIAAEGATRVVFVPLAAIRNPAFVASAIAEALGLSDVSALDLPKRARVACDDHPTLLVLDNFEQVLDAAPLVADLLTSAASLRVLATSRAPLRVREGRGGSMPSDRSRWRWTRMRCRPPIWHVLLRSGYCWSAFGTCSLTFGPRPRTAPPWRRFAGGSMHCRSPSSLQPGGSKC